MYVTCYTSTCFIVLQFLQGLMELDKDEFVNRKIKQIFSRYFHSYLQPSGPVQLVQTSSPNPFMILLAPAFGTQPSSDTRLYNITSQ